MTSYNHQNSNQQQPMNTEYHSKETETLFQRSMLVMWGKMTRLYHPQWIRTNGDIGSPVFQDWVEELRPYGSQGVMRGLEAIKAAGNVYMPNLNKFMCECRAGNSTARGDGDVFGRKTKPTPDGVPLCWTIAPYEEYTKQDYLDSGTTEDSEHAKTIGL